MKIGKLQKGLACVMLAGLTFLNLCSAAITAEISPPGMYQTSWIGNSFGGGGAVGKEGVGFHANGYGYWVQEYMGVMAVSPDGTVFNSVTWDEGGHGIGLYKNGLPNRVPVVARSLERAPGFNTAGNAVCVDGDFFFVGNVKGALLRFSWSPGDINSSRYIGETLLPEKPLGLSCGNGKILVGYADRIELRDETSMQPITSYPASDVGAVLLAPDGSFWVIAGGQVRHLRQDGEDTGVTLPDIGAPASLAWGNNGRLLVSDNGPAQQVLCFNVSGQPKLVSSFGVKGGLYSGTPGAPAALKLFSLRGAGMDAAGNLYVGMGAPGEGNAFLRAFSPTGNLLWQVYAAAFVDTFGFEPGSDGTVVYSRTARWRLDLDRHAPGTEATLTAITVDPLHDPDDPRIGGRFSVYPRLLGGTQLLYATGQYGRGFDIFAGAPGTDILRQVGKTPAVGWAWCVTDAGDIWNGDAPAKKILLYPLQGVTDGRPVYDWQHPRKWPWPADFQKISRVIYNKPTDSLYIFGYLNDQDAKGPWGLVGFTARRYDGWLAGNPHIVWTNTSLPQTVVRMRGVSSLAAKGVSLAGDYLFLGMVKTIQQPSVPTVNILNAHTGQLVGTITAGPEVGGIGGIEDMVNSVQATKRSNGEYLILMEDDWRAKNILFRWSP